MTPCCLLWRHIDQQSFYSIDIWELYYHTRGDVKAVVKTKKAIEIYGEEVDIGENLSNEKKERLLSILNIPLRCFCSKTIDDLGFPDTVKHEILKSDEVTINYHIDSSLLIWSRKWSRTSRLSWNKA